MIMSEELLQQIGTLKEVANSKGFQVSYLDRGQHQKYIDGVAGRYELWLEGHWFDSKIYFCQTLEELCEKGIQEVMSAMEKSTPGRFRD
jgi:hypothetical protein